MKKLSVGVILGWSLVATPAFAVCPTNLQLKDNAGVTAPGKYTDDGSGNCQANVATQDGADVTQGAKADTAYAGTGAASIVAILKGLYSSAAGPIPTGTNSIGGVTTADGAQVTVGAKTDTAYTGSGSASVVAALKGVYSAVTGPVPAGTNSIGGVTTADGAQVTIGAKADTAYAGSGAASVVAVLKGIYANISAPLPLGTTGGWTPVVKTAINATAQTIKSSAGWLGKVQCDNQNASWAYLQIFNTTTPTVGTTAPLAIVPMPPSLSNGFVQNGIGEQYSTAIAVAATTTATGATGVTTGVNCSFAFN